MEENRNNQPEGMNDQPVNEQPETNQPDSNPSENINNQPGGGQSGSTGNYPPIDNQNPPGKNVAIASLVLGIVGVVCWFFGWSAIISVVVGIIGLVLASNAKKAGYTENLRTAGFILSLISLIGGAVFFVACVACTGALVASGIASGAL